MSQGRRTRLVVAVWVAALFAGSCTAERDKQAPALTEHRQVVVASFNFPESELLAEIYAQILEARGIRVRLELDLGTRELVLPAFQQGFVDVVPEYVGSVTAALASDLLTDVGDARAVHSTLARALTQWGARPLRMSAAQNVNGVVVGRAMAEELRLASISDLARVASSLTLGGPPECPVRPYCMLGLERVYGLHFAAFVPLEGEQRVLRALDDGFVDAGIMFTTDGALARRELTLLTDDRGLQPADNVVPLVRDDALQRYGTVLTSALNAVSTRLTTESLRFLNWRVSIAGHSAADEARGWLLRHGLVPRDS